MSAIALIGLNGSLYTNRFLKDCADLNYSPRLIYDSSLGHKDKTLGLLKNFDEVLDLNQSSVAELKQFLATVRAITCYSEQRLSLYRHVAKYCPPHLCRPSDESLKILASKHLSNQVFLKYAGEVAAQNVVFSGDEEELSAIVAHLKYPLIIKPRSLQSSRYVERVDDLDALQRKLLAKQAHLKQNLAQISKTKTDAGFIVEEFIEGTHFTLDGYVDRDYGVCLGPLLRMVNTSERGLPGYATFKTTNNFNVPDTMAEALVELQRSLAKIFIGIGFRCSTFMVDLVYAAERNFKLIEIGPRTGGARYREYQTGYGIEHGQNDIKVRKGEKIECRFIHQRYVSSLRLFPQTEGQLISIEHLARLKTLSSYDSHSILVKEGEPVTFPVNGGKAAVAVYLSNSDKEVLEKDEKYVLSSITFKVKEL